MKNNSKNVILIAILLVVSMVPLFSQANGCGDVNKDGLTDIVDALLIAKAYVGGPSVSKESADVNSDNTVDIVDALLIAKYYVGVGTQLNCKKSELPKPNNSLMGWATQGGGTKGGGNSKAVNVSSLSACNKAAGGSGSKVIYLSGKHKGKLKVGSNKTIIGKPGTEIRGGGALSLKGSKNVIIKNIKFIGSPNGSGDTGNFHSSRNIWLDHCEFVDGGDGMLDIVHGCNYITISWCKFWYTKQTGHQNAMLISHSDGAKDSGKMNITLHHNWWWKNVAERQPRVRFGKVHIFNSLYEATKGFTSYAIRPGYKANILSESNVFKDFTGKSKAAGDAKHKTGECLVFNYAFNKKNSTLETKNDVFINCTKKGIDADDVEGGTFGNGKAFKPPYNYTVDPTSSLEAAIKAGAGPTLK